MHGKNVIVKKLYKFTYNFLTFFELLLRETNLDQIETFRNKVNIADFDEPAARKASFIFKELKKKGKTIDFRDIFTASICIANNLSLLTFNTKHFRNIGQIKLLPKVFTSI